MPLSLRREALRKAVHVAFAVVPVLYAHGVARSALAIVLAVLAAGGIGIELMRRRYAVVDRMFVLGAGAVLRPGEHARWTGATWLVMTLLGCVLLAPRPMAVAAMWAVTVGDAAAAVVGRGWSHVRPRTDAAARKTVAGSAACLATSLAGAVLVAHLSLGASVTSAVGATVAEWPDVPLNDNPRVAAGAVFGILLWHMMFS